MLLPFFRETGDAAGALLAYDAALDIARRENEGSSRELALQVRAKYNC